MIYGHFAINFTDFRTSPAIVCTWADIDWPIQAKITEYVHNYVILDSTKFGANISNGLRAINF